MIKVLTGYRKEQYYAIPDEEAHIAYYLFAHPEARAVFSNGVALRGDDIKGIEPAWNEVMGWNPTHQLDSDDWNEIRSSGNESKMRRRLELAKRVSSTMSPVDMRVSLPELAKRMKLIGNDNKLLN